MPHAGNVSDQGLNEISNGPICNLVQVYWNVLGAQKSTFIREGAQLPSRQIN